MHVLITGAWAGAAACIPALEKQGHSVVFLQNEQDALPCPPEWVEATVCNGLFLHHPLERFINLRLIQLTSAGYDRVDMAYLRAHHIEIRNAKGVYSIPMAEFALTGVLDLYKQSRFFCENQKARRWEKHRALRELCGKTVLIVGCGDVGAECAKRFRAFGCRVIGLNRTARENPAFDEIRSADTLDAVLPEADIVVLSIALSDKTRHLMNASRLSRLKDGAVLVNLARGALLDTQALLPVLPRLGGAVLDVFETEPLPEGSPLWERENVILTPHNSFVGEGNGERLDKLIMENLRSARS